jgi:hypothetical protein
MAELMRVFAGRGPVPLAETQVETFGVQSHPEDLQSLNYQNWVQMCKQSDFEKLQAEMFSFLSGADSVKTLDDLHGRIGPALQEFLKRGNDVRPKDLKLFVSRLDVKSQEFSSAYSRLGDTMLALSNLKQLSHPLNLDYQSALKALALAKWVQTHEAPQLYEKPLSFLDRPVLMPVCFHRKNPCRQGAVSGKDGFWYLDGLQGQREEKQSPSCVSGDCSCSENTSCLDQSKCCAQVSLYVIDLMMVRDYTKCFKPGDLSYIKNILAGESLSTVHRQTDTTVEMFETEETITNIDESYLEHHDTSKLNNEITNELKQEIKFTAGVSVNYKYGAETTIGKWDITGTADYTNTTNKSLVQKETREYTKDVIERATKRVESTIRKKRTLTRTSETEETNTHGFNNTSSTDNITGQYLFVDKVSKAQMYNYGKKAVVEFYLPEPASLYNHLWKSAFDGTEPLKPTAPGILLSDIKADSYEAMMTQYGIQNAPTPPPAFKDVVTEFKGEPGDRGSGSYVQTLQITIPPDYVASSMDAQIIQLNYNSHMGVSCSITLGNAAVWHSKKDGTQSLHANLPPLEGTNPAVLHAWDVTDYDWVLTVHCALKAEVLQAWQQSILDLITNKYNAQLEVYNEAYDKYLEAKAEFEAQELAKRIERNGRNPLLNREIEKVELKRMAISYLSCQFFDQFDAMKSKVKPCGYPEMSIGEAQEEGRFIQFFEQAFDWNLMTYMFYPYFWGRKCSWKDKVQDESGDFVFNRFLTAGSSRVAVPVRDGYFDYVQYFLATGDIWGGTGVPPLPNDPHYVAMAQEIKEQKGNYYVDRAGYLEVTQASNVVTLYDNSQYWDTVNNVVDALAVAADINRELIVDCVIYRIVSIVENTLVPGHTSWTTTLERPYEGATSPNILWSTGAVFVGSPWEYTTPTNLVFLRKPSACLPTYPLAECPE